MCSILGGTTFNEYANDVFQLSMDRGRDYSGLSNYAGSWIANHRATPTNEVEYANTNQPFGIDGIKLVHNGTIANDMELGNPEGEIDSSVLTRVLRFGSFSRFADSLEAIRGSYAIAVLHPDGRIWLACNYKPIWWIERGGELFFSSLERHLPGKPHRVEPYSCYDLREQISIPLKRNQPDRALVVCSGGLDSTAVTGFAKDQHKEIRLLHFDYGCKATDKEIGAIGQIAKALKVESVVVPIDFRPFAGTSTLHQSTTIEGGEKAVEYALDWVPARNLLMLALATSYAEANGFGYIYLGNNLEEAGAYPDNEEQFILDFNKCLWGAVNNGYKVEVRNPLGGLMKREIVTFGLKYDSPIHLSWSCYNDGENHCGKCGPCYMRRKAFERNNLTDPTTYDN
jgi:7-cyano-7-deazaguanine synthase